MHNWQKPKWVHTFVNYIIKYANRKKSAEKKHRYILHSIARNEQYGRADDDVSECTPRAISLLPCCTPNTAAQGYGLFACVKCAFNSCVRCWFYIYEYIQSANTWYLNGTADIYMFPCVCARARASWVACDQLCGYIHCIKNVSIGIARSSHSYTQSSSTRIVRAKIRNYPNADRLYITARRVNEQRQRAHTHLIQTSINRRADRRLLGVLRRIYIYIYIYIYMCYIYYCRLHGGFAKGSTRALVWAISM